MIRKISVTAFIFITLLSFIADNTYAYLGPGAGLGMIGSLIAVIAASIVIIAGLVIYPIRRLLNYRKSKEG